MEHETIMMQAMMQAQEAQATGSHHHHRSEKDWSSSSQGLHSRLQHQSEGMLENTFYHSSDYTPYNNHSLQQERQQSRSNPITIIRGVNAKDQNVDSDSDDSVLDVERDAVKLRHQFGASSYAAGTSYQSDLRDSKKMLKAPYLGSLSKSENFLMTLPPITLSDYEMEEPLPEITQSYGSLRDSHQRGRFLDGPSSYREPRSGQIRLLDPRLRYQASSQPSIGERMQQARKLVEIKKQEQKDEGTTSNNEDNDNSSSLSAMMNDASRQEQKSHIHEPAYGVDREVLTAFGDGHEDLDSPSMMSTSLTAFELLKTPGMGKKDSPGYCQSHREMDDHDNLFNPFSRSMSDPTSQSYGQFMLSPQASTVSQSLLETDLIASTAAMNVNDFSGNYANASVMHYGGSPSHNPDMDGAFDMEDL